METALISALVAGIVVPYVVSFLKDVEWSAKVKQLLTTVVSLVFAFGIVVVDQGVEISNWDEFVANAGVVFTTSQLFYKQWFEETKTNDKLEVDMGVGKQ